MTGLKYKEMAQISCGAYHTAAVSCDGDCYVWGRGDERLGLDSLDGDVLEPRLNSHIGYKKNSISFVTRVCAAEDHTLLLCKDGSVLAWGKGKYGKLGVQRNVDKRKREKFRDYAKPIAVVEDL